MTPLERDIEAKLRTIVQACGGYSLKWVCPGWSGVPDRIVLLPGARIFFVETKRPKGGKVSKLQELWWRRLTTLGFQHRFIWNEEDLQRFKEELREGVMP